MTCESHIQAYVGHLESEIHCTEIDGGVVLTMPMTYADGDNVEVAVGTGPHGVRVSDLGEAHLRLSLGGLNIDSPRVRKRVTNVLRGYGLELAGGQVVAHGEDEFAGEMITRMSAALLSLDALSAMRQDRTKAGFQGRVVDYLRGNFESVTPDPVLYGRSGTRYPLTAAVRRGPDETVYVSALGSGTAESTKQSATRAFRVFADVNGVLPAERKVALLDDSRNAWRREDVTLLASVAYVAVWSRRDAFEEFVRSGTAEDHLLGIDLQSTLDA
jgi:hypothetical protein